MLSSFRMKLIGVSVLVVAAASCAALAGAADDMTVARVFYVLTIVSVLGAGVTAYRAKITRSRERR